MKNRFEIALTLLTGWFRWLRYGENTRLFQRGRYTDRSGSSLPYRILFPEGHDTKNRYPLILFLHGAGERGNDNRRQLLHVGGLFTRPGYRHEFPCIVVAPQCPENSYWASVKRGQREGDPNFSFDYTLPVTDSLQGAVDLVREIAATEAVDPNRIFIAGLSMGGMGTFEAVYRYPSLFSAAIAVCGGADVDAYDARVRPTRFRIFHGDEDHVVNVNFSRAITAKLRALNADVTYTEYLGVGHNSWDRAFRDRGLMGWLSAN